MQEHAKRLMALFPTLPGVYYKRSQVPASDGSDKVQVKQVAVRLPLTLDTVDDHLNGGLGVAVSPFMQDGLSVQFLCLDLDIYGLSLEDVLHAISTSPMSSLPWVPAATKSGGWHLFLFFDAPVKAQQVVLTCKKFKAWMITALSAMSVIQTSYEAAARDFKQPWTLVKWLVNKGVEYRPVQTSIKPWEGDVGTGITLPLYNTTKEEQEAWLTQAEESKVTAEVLNDVLDEGPLAEAPPCLFSLYQAGERLGWKNTGFRNDFLYQLCVFFRKKFPAQWQDRVRDYNDRVVGKSGSELDSIISSVEKQDNAKAYKCNGVFADHCNKSICNQRKYGIGATVASDLLDMDGIVRVEGDPVTWYITLHTPHGDKRLKLTTDELYSPDTVRKRCMEYGVLPDLPKGKQWDEQLRVIISKASVVEQAEGMSPMKRTEDLIWKFFECTPTTADVKGVLVGKTFLENTPDGVCYAYFRHTDLEVFAERTRSKTGGSLYQQMQEYILSGSGAVAQVRLEGISLEVWRVPVPEFRMSLEMERRVK